MAKPQAINEEALIAQISKAQTVVEQLESLEAWKYVVEDFQNQVDMIDKNWHFISPEEKSANGVNKLSELRLTKMASLSLVNLLDSYKYQAEQATAQLEALRKYPNEAE